VENGTALQLMMLGGFDEFESNYGQTIYFSEFDLASTRSWFRFDVQELYASLADRQCPQNLASMQIRIGSGCILAHWEIRPFVSVSGLLPHRG
jgi:hypothetical protein